MNMQANTCKYTGLAFRETKKFGAKFLQKIARNSPNHQTKIFVTKRFQISPDFRNLAIKPPIWKGGRLSSEHKT